MKYPGGWEISRLEERQGFLLPFIEEVHAVIPTDTWIDSLTITDARTVEIEGGSVDKNSAIYFMDTLMRNFPQIKEINALESHRSGNGLHYSFKIGVRF